jgi:hypothetical protein
MPVTLYTHTRIQVEIGTQWLFSNMLSMWPKVQKNVKSTVMFGFSLVSGELLCAQLFFFKLLPCNL